MSEDLTLFSLPELKGVVQDMRDLLSQSRLVFLLGAGCSKNAGLPLLLELTEEVLGHVKIGEETVKLLSTVRKLFSGAEVSTIEDFMSEIVDLLSYGANIRTSRMILLSNNIKDNLLCNDKRYTTFPPSCNRPSRLD
jgi:hypothetical protein